MTLTAMDRERVETTVRWIKEASTVDMLRFLLPDCSNTIIYALERNMTFLHTGMLIFPEHLLEVQRLLTELDMTISLIVPSLIVRQRVAQRYQLDENQLDVQIIESSCQRMDGDVGTLELFVLLQSAPGITDAMQKAESREEYENHIAFTPHSAHGYQEVLETLKALGFCHDGGGINPWEDAQKAVTYLSHVSNKGRRRIELQTLV